MAWRVLASGPMLEIEGGGVKGGAKSFTQTVIATEGEIIESPRDLSAAMISRYEKGDDFMRALVEYGEIELEEDEDGEPVKTFVPKGYEDPDAAEDAPQTDEEALQRTQEAESKVQELEAKVAELEASAGEAGANAGRVQELEAELDGKVKEFDELKAQYEKDLSELAAEPFDYARLSPEALEAETTKRVLDVTGTGANGNVKKEDRVKALQEADKA